MTKNTKNIAIIIIIIALLAGGYLLFGQQKKAPTYEFTTVKRGKIVQEVNVTGRVNPAEKVDLAFERSGKIAHVYAKVGDTVKTGDTLVDLNSDDIKAQLSQAESQVASAKSTLSQYQASLDSQQAKLDELKRGTRPEELAIAETNVTNAQKALADAQTNLANVKNQAAVNLNQAYDSAINAAAKSVSVATNSLIVLTNVQYAHFNDYSPNGISIANAKATAVYALLGGQNAGYWSNTSISQANGGTEAIVQQAQANPAHDNINNALTALKDALNKVRNALDAVPYTSDLTSTETGNLNTEKSNINGELITTTSKQQAITVQKATNDSLISSAQIQINSANSALLSAQDNLALKQAGSTPEQIAGQGALVRQAEASLETQKTQIQSAEDNVRNIQSQLAKTILHSPIDGIVTMQDAKEGEIVSPNAPIVSLISEAKFQIETNVPEADIAKIKIGDTAKVTLDAYGNDVIFEAKVITIDPAEVIIEGVATYKVTLEFTKEDDHIKSGMTANIDVLTASRDNALIIPQRAVITKDNQKFVLLNTGKDKPEERRIETGIRGSDGSIEVLSGLAENDKIVSYGGSL